jgi:ribosomal protein L13E
MKRNLVTRTVGSILILRQSADPPSEPEWEESLRTLNALFREHGPNVRALVYTDGGAPSPVQRASLQKALEKTPIPAAVVSDNVKARMTSSTVALANRKHRSFAVEELSKAYLHLGLTADETRAVEDALKGMAALLAT